MGLDTSHDCWHGSYSSFNRFREQLARAAGLPDLNSMVGFGGEIQWETLIPNPIHLLLHHSDCDGELEWKDCNAIADSLDAIRERMDENWVPKLDQFSKGLRLAASKQENVNFH